VDWIDPWSAQPKTAECVFTTKHMYNVSLRSKNNECRNCIRVKQHVYSQTVV
jgi:hypothetical protein